VRSDELFTADRMKDPNLQGGNIHVEELSSNNKLTTAINTPIM